MDILYCYLDGFTSLLSRFSWVHMIHIIILISVFAPCTSEKERNNSEPEQINGSETDLTAVLNAWYSAGFYTGK